MQIFFFVFFVEIRPISSENELSKGLDLFNWHQLIFWGLADGGNRTHDPNNGPLYKPNIGSALAHSATVTSFK